MVRVVQFNSSVFFVHRALTLNVCVSPFRKVALVDGVLGTQQPGGIKWVSVWGVAWCSSILLFFSPVHRVLTLNVCVSPFRKVALVDGVLGTQQPGGIKWVSVWGVAWCSSILLFFSPVHRVLTLNVCVSPFRTLMRRGPPKTLKKPYKTYKKYANIVPRSPLLPMVLVIGENHTWHQFGPCLNKNWPP